MTKSSKICFKCQVEKPVDQFYRHPRMADGRLNKCKECAKKDTTKNREDNIDYYQEYDRKRYKENDERRVKTQERFKKRQESCPAATKATQIASNAIRDGRLIKKPCEVCDSHNSEAHHPDYLKPLEVMWLCRSHHVKWHKENGPGANADAPVEMINY